MRRREFITLLGGAAATWPLAALAQQAERTRLIGVLMAMVENDPEARLRLAAFRQGLREIGWTESRNIHIEFRWAGDEPKLARAYAVELVGSAPEIIVAHASNALAAVQQQTRTLPIVFVQVPDPVGQGFIASLVQPGGNTTGFASFEDSISAKWLELLKELVPQVSGCFSRRGPIRTFPLGRTLGAERHTKTFRLGRMNINIEPSALRAERHSKSQGSTTTPS
jgi:putative ABC transport system substrate-binding protein